MPFAGSGLEADPFFSADGRTLYFISSRQTGEIKSSALDIWQVRRGVDGRWGNPERLPAPVNSDEAEWFPRPAADGWLYFGSRREGGLGKDDIWRARRNVAGRWHAEHVDGDINSAGAEYELLPSPDGSWGILAEHDVTDRTRPAVTLAPFRQHATYGQVFWSMREWLVVTDTARWELLAAEAYAFVAGAGGGADKA